jgi:tetratricopeptide (TPR) repeat protein
LRHPGIAQVFEAGTHHEDGEDTPFFVMEYIPGALCVTEYARKHDLSIRDRMKLFLQVCDAVQHGHLKGIVHRDLKPGNILVSSNGKLKIIDFGVARSTDSDLAVTTQQTDIGQILGTVQYMSPEQCEADPNDIDTRSDVYALGVVLHELLTGQLPYDIGTAQLHEAIRIVREQMPARLSSVDRRLKGDLEVITGKAMEKERRRRYQTASALSEDIGHWLDDEPINAKAPCAMDTLVRFARRHTATAAAIGAVFIILIAAVAAITTVAIDANEQRLAAQAAQTEEQDQREQAEAVKDFLTSMIASIDPATAGNMDKELLVHTLTQAANRVSTNFANQPLLEAELRGTIGESYHTLGMYGDANEHLERAVSLLEASGDSNSPLLLRFLLRKARNIRSTGKYELGLGLAQEHLDRAIDAGMPELYIAKAYQTVAMMCIDPLEFDRAHTALNAARELYKRHPNSKQYVTFLFITSQLVGQQGSLKRAAQWAQKALDAYESLPNKDPVMEADLLYHLAICLSYEERYEESLIALNDVLSIHQEMLGNTHPQSLEVMGTLGAIYAIMGELDKAEPCFRQVYEAQLETLGSEHHNTLVSMGNLGMLLKDQDKLDASEAVLEPALAITLRVYGEDHSATQHRRRFLAQLRMRQGQSAEAVELLTLATAAMKNAFGPSHRLSLEFQEELDSTKQAIAESTTTSPQPSP